MKQLYLLIIFFSINCFSQDEFITVWKTTPSNTSISFSTPVNDSPYTYIWQRVDENFAELTPFSAETIVPINNGNITIQFPEDGFYRLLITSNASQFHIKINNQRLLRIEQWGNINWSSFANSFSGCTNLNITAYDIPNLSNVTNLNKMFYGCTNLIFNSSISFWEVGTITDFSEMFSNATLFNQDLQRWDTSSATTMSEMFSKALNFNSPINTWDVSNVTTFNRMFHDANFNQPLNEWVTTSATNMGHMFCRDVHFNQDISNFDVSQVEDIEWFIQGATNFNQDLSSFQLNSVTNAILFFDNSGVDCENFTNTIASWANNPNLPNDIVLGVMNMQYSNGLIPILNWFTNTKNWTFIGNMNESPECTLSNIDFQTSLIKIYPNPTSDILNIEGIEVEKIDIYDAEGKLVQKTLNNNQVDISHLSTGKYFLIINDQYKESILKK